jgi:hypothetical protein
MTDIRTRARTFVYEANGVELLELFELLKKSFYKCEGAKSIFYFCLIKFNDNNFIFQTRRNGQPADWFMA